MADDKLALRENLMLSLTETVQELQRMSLSKNTRKAYVKDWKVFERFCDENNFNAIPCNPDTLCLFIADSHNKNKKPSTITRYVTAICRIHEALGEMCPRTESVRATLSGLKKTRGSSKKKVHAISWQELCFMLEAGWMFQGEKYPLLKRDTALLSIGWFGALRRSEIVNLDWRDIEFVKEGIILNIRFSKTDQEGHGEIIAIPNIGGRFCPVHHLSLWRDYCEKLEMMKGPVFISLGQKGRKLDAKGEKRLGGRMVSVIVKRLSRWANIDASNVSAHSLRRGFCTTAASAGVDERILQRHSRHSSSESLREYIDRGRVFLDNPIALMGSVFRN